jgi:ribosomal protein S18 acetylase RimI-like enzyme
MIIKVVSINKIKTSKLNYFTNVIFNNFLHLQNVSNLSHSKKNIFEVLTSKEPQIYLVLNDDKKIIAYLVGEIVELVDGRKVLYITYLFTSKKHRKNGCASKLLYVAEDIIRKQNLNGLMLTCDSENPYVYDFYLKKGFMPDILLRTYKKYEVMYKM